MEGRDERRDMARHFGRNLFRRRRWAGYSQEEVSKRTGLHRTEVGLLEAGRRTPRIDTLMKLAGALEVEPGILLAGIEWLAPGPPAGGSFLLRSEEAVAHAG